MLDHKSKLKFPVRRTQAQEDWLTCPRPQDPDKHNLNDGLSSDTVQCTWDFGVEQGELNRAAF